MSDPHPYEYLRGIRRYHCGDCNLMLTLRWPDEEQIPAEMLAKPWWCRQCRSSHHVHVRPHPLAPDAHERLMLLVENDIQGDADRTDIDCNGYTYDGDILPPVDLPAFVAYKDQGDAGQDRRSDAGDVARQSDDEQVRVEASSTSSPPEWSQPFTATPRRQRRKATDVDPAEVERERQHQREVWEFLAVISAEDARNGNLD